MRRLAKAAVLVLSIAPVPSLAPRSGVTPAAVARWTAEDAAALDARIAEVEERLLVQQARVSFWREMRERHESVTAIACQNLAQHATAIQASETRLQARSAGERRHRIAAAKSFEE